MTGSNADEILKEVDTCNIHDYSAHIHTHVKEDIEKKGAYYDDTIPCDDPKFLGPIRRWEKRMGFETAIIWRHIFLITALHLLALVGPLLCIRKVSLKIVLFSYLMGNIGGFGVTAGAHRYWTHRSYKAKLPFQILLVLCFATAGQNKIFDWVRDHRVHHKCSESTADPHNARRGFFFSHVGWLMMKKHPHVIREGKKIYLDDIRNDPLVTIYTKYFWILQIICCIILPTVAPVYLWGEDWAMSFFANITRYTLNLNFTWAVNSFAHLWGNKPYNPSIMPVENWGVSIVAMGEGWHNYHHTFPWDYKAAELAYFINITTAVLDAFAKIGWVYDRKQASQPQIQYVIDNHAQTQQSSCISKNKTD